MQKPAQAGQTVSWAAARNGLFATALLAAGIVAGSRRLADFDAALVGYTFACLFALFGIVYRYSVWLSKPPTRLFFRRGFGLFFRRPGALLGAAWSKLVAQDFIFRRGAARWAAHMLIAYGCALAAAITFPLVFGWLHFEPGAEGHYRVVAFGIRVAELRLGGIAAWLVLRGLVISSFLVIPGVMIAMWRRLRDGGAIAVQRFGRDLLPLFMLFAVSATGLMLWVSYEFLKGTWYAVLAQIHAFTVIATLIYLPFGKLFHIFQRPASLGIAVYRAEAARSKQAVCPVTHQEFAPETQLTDVESVLPEVGFDYSAIRWTRVSPAGKRRLIARAQSRAKSGRFS
jgi:hypothetical protein